MSRLLDHFSRFGLGPGAVVDVASVMHGVRPMGLFHLPSERDEELGEALRRAGLSVIHRRFLTRRSDPCSHDSLLESDGGPAAPGSAAGRWSETWFAARGTSQAAAADLEGRTGELLGYPPCCTAANRACKSLAPYYLRYLTSGVPGFWQANRLATAITGARTLPDYFPCSLRCEASMELSERCMDALRRETGDEWVASMVADLRAPLTLWGGSIVLWRQWTSDGGTLELRAAGAVSVQASSIVRVPGGQMPAADRPVLVPFEHLGHPRRVRLVSADGSSEEAMLDLIH